MYPYFFFSNYKATEPHPCFPAGRPTSITMCSCVLLVGLGNSFDRVSGFKMVLSSTKCLPKSMSSIWRSGQMHFNVSTCFSLSLPVLFLRQQLCLLPPRILSNWSLPTIPGSKVLSRTTMSEHCWNIAHQRVWERDINLELNVEWDGAWLSPEALWNLLPSTETKERVDHFRFLVATISNDLSCNNNNKVESFIKNAKHRLYFLWQLNKFWVYEDILDQFHGGRWGFLHYLELSV